MSDKERIEEIQNEVRGFSFGEDARQPNTAPEGYFDQLPDRVLMRWHKEKQTSPSRTISLRKLISTAAIVSGICLGVMWLTNQAAPAIVDVEISSADAYLYILEHIDDFAPWIQDESLAEDIKTPIPDSSAIKEYLIEELDGEDPETIF
jgi:hypothetical protein